MRHVKVTYTNLNTFETVTFNGVIIMETLLCHDQENIETRWVLSLSERKASGKKYGWWLTKPDSFEDKNSTLSVVNVPDLPCIIYIKDETHFKLVQQALFKSGCKWKSGATNLLHLGEKPVFVAVSEVGTIGYSTRASSSSRYSMHNTVEVEIGDGFVPVFNTVYSPKKEATLTFKKVNDYDISILLVDKETGETICELCNISEKGINRFNSTIAATGYDIAKGFLGTDGRLEDCTFEDCTFE